MPQHPFESALVPNWSQFPKESSLSPQFTEPFMVLDSNWYPPGTPGQPFPSQMNWLQRVPSSAKLTAGAVGYISSNLNSGALTTLNTLNPPVMNYWICYYSITAARTVYLPGAVYPGQMVTVADFSGSLSPTVYIGILPTGTDTVDWGSSNTLYMPYGSRTLLCVTPGRWITVGTQGQKWAVSYTGGGTHTPASNIKYVTVTCVGAGGGGGGYNSTYRHGGGGGGGGAVVIKTVNVSPYTGYTVTNNGAGGGGSQGTNGGYGGSSSFGVLVSAAGGSAGMTSSGFAAGGMYGSTQSSPQGNGAPGCGGGGGATAYYGGTWMGAGGAPGTGATSNGNGGGGSYGDGGAGAGTGAATAGTDGGGGGGGSNNSTSGASGGGGLVIVEWVIV